MDLPQGAMLGDLYQNFLGNVIFHGGGPDSLFPFGSAHVLVMLTSNV